MAFGVDILIGAQPQRVYTLEELAKFNGKNGARAYVVVNGLVYDLTDVPEWAQGRHYCSGAVAGKDITFLWNLVPASHRGPNFLKRFPVMGKLVSSKPQQKNTTPSSTPAGGSSLWWII
jgi:predicted heme/steroid binding protein